MKSSNQKGHVFWKKSALVQSEDHGHDTVNAGEILVLGSVLPWDRWLL